jgi:hypothetical protein
VRDLDAELGQSMVEKAERAAVERLVGNDFIARRQQGPEQRGGGALAGSGRQGGLATLEVGDPGFEQGGGRVAYARIDKARLLAGEPRAAVLDGRECVGRTQIDGRIERAVTGVGVIREVNGAGIEARATRSGCAHVECLGDRCPATNLTRGGGSVRRHCRRPARPAAPRTASRGRQAWQ